MAAEQDTDPAYGLTHASYARTIYEGLAAYAIPLGNRLTLAGAQQDRWGSLLRRRLGLPTVPRGLVELRTIGPRRTT